MHCTDCVEDEKYEAHDSWFHKYCIAKSKNAGVQLKEQLYVKVLFKIGTNVNF